MDDAGLDKCWLEDQLKTIRNMCDIALLLHEQKQEGLLPTMLERILVEVQTIVEDHCIIGGE